MRGPLLACALAVTAAMTAPGGQASAHEHAADAKAAAKHKNAPSSFAAQPAKGTWATCPVSGEVFQIDGDTGFTNYGGRVYAFCCPDCKPDFDKTPAKFVKK